MKSIPLKELKQNLSRYAEEAATGASIQITRYNKPFMLLVPASPTTLQVGTRVGSGSLRSALKKGAKVDFLRTLREDRDG